MLEFEERRLRARWIAQNVLPHEHRIRTWLKRARMSPDDINDLIQDSYCKLAMTKTVAHIDDGGAYFFTIARNLMLRHLNRLKVVPIEALSDLSELPDDRSVSPEQEVAARMDHARLLAMIANLPERCRSTVHLRKIEGWSQKRIAEHLGTTEKAVEKRVWEGIRAIRLAWSRIDSEECKPPRRLAGERKARP